ncbi:unnamed protein product [Pleuronectes platessa]|uniref:Uncharacterized protein n=1 Tax=Pleuronectes platessa TaxID=8262 RepID=A0A9N7YEE3_PLEPL|nr:unnamed protein product [Pleuronectes platessa]
MCWFNDVRTALGSRVVIEQPEPPRLHPSSWTSLLVISAMGHLWTCRVHSHSPGLPEARDSAWVLIPGWMSLRWVTLCNLVPRSVWGLQAFRTTQHPAAAPGPSAWKTPELSRLFDGGRQPHKSQRRVVAAARAADRRPEERSQQRNWLQRNWLQRNWFPAQNWDEQGILMSRFRSEKLSVSVSFQSLLVSLSLLSRLLQSYQAK